MSSAIIAPLPMTVSRPKIHRPPGVGARKHSEKPGLPGFLLFWAAVLLTLIGVSLSINKEHKESVIQATTLPAVAVVSQRLPVAEPASVPAPAVAALTETSVIPTPIGDAQASPVATPALAAPASKQGDTILLQDKSGAIVGQMARIPFGDEQITEVKAINDVDNASGRELLSIVGKY